MASRKIGRDINNTFNKLEKLAICKNLILINLQYYVIKHTNIETIYSNFLHKIIFSG